MYMYKMYGGECGWDLANEIWGTADEAVLNNVQKKKQKFLMTHTVNSYSYTVTIEK
jgi:hypothetical protein